MSAGPRAAATPSTRRLGAALAALLGIQLAQAAAAHHCPVTLELASPDLWAVSMPTKGIQVEASEALRSSLEKLLGEKVCDFR